MNYAFFSFEYFLLKHGNPTLKSWKNGWMNAVSPSSSYHLHHPCSGIVLYRRSNYKCNLFRIGNGSSHGGDGWRRWNGCLLRQSRGCYRQDYSCMDSTWVKTRPNTRHKMRLAGVLEKVIQTDGWTDQPTDRGTNGRMDRRTDSHTLQRCNIASKNAVFLC